MARRSRAFEDDPELKALVKSVHWSSLYWDFTIRCGAGTFRVHRLVLHAHSSWFRKLFGITDALLQVHLMEDPRIFSVLVRHIYQHEFTCEPPPDMSLQSYYIQVFAMAEKYELRTLRLLAVDRLQRLIRSPTGELRIAPKLFVEILYTMDEEGGPKDGLLWSLLVAIAEDNGRVLIEDKESGFDQACIAIPYLNKKLMTRLILLNSRRRSLG
ncbi:hypothetical protein BST61_g8665 [Cercospora zeina]